MDLIANLLRFNPDQRISAEQALKHEYFDEVKHMNPDLARLGNHTSKILDSSLGVKALHP
jgi:serine/threonine protein kinase